MLQPGSTLMTDAKCKKPDMKDHALYAVSIKGNYRD